MHNGPTGKQESQKSRGMQCDCLLAGRANDAWRGLKPWPDWMRAPGNEHRQERARG